MTDLLWGEIRSLLHADKIKRQKAREIALALAEGMSEERAEQLLMLVDGLTHKRGDVIVDGEWVDTDLDIESMTLKELKALHDCIEPPMLRLVKHSNAILHKHNSVVKKAHAAVQALADVASVAHDPELSKQVMPTILSNFITRLLAAQRDVATEDDDLKITWEVSHDDT